MFKTTLLLFSLSAFFLFSCGQNSSESNTKVETVSLVVKDSIDISYLGKLMLQDVDTKNSRLLLYDQQQRLFLITNMKGDILHQFGKQKDSKGGINYQYGPAKFFKEGQVQIIGMQGFSWFDFNGELLDHKKFTNEEPPSFSARPMLAEEFALIDGKYLGKAVRARGQYSIIDPEFYDEFQLLAWFDTKEATYKRVFGLENESLFKNGMAYDVTEMMPTHTYFDNKIFIAVGVDPHLNIYQSQPPYSLLSRVPLQYSPFFQSEGEEPAKADPLAIKGPGASGHTQNLKATSKYLIIGFVSGYNPDKETDGVRPKSSEHFYIMDHEGKMMTILDNTFDINLREFTTRNDEIWAVKKISQEVEEDFIRIYRMAIEKQ
ncbi:hypothetical protein [Echinicola sp. 20G]|uniref:hypothetical protein n=1 Tax=Echinicola sp. 20G TaxID=2781961 RepID=UPI00190FF8D6|nr:hypothetical protein [Echinicola sp. 20G]